MVEAMKSGDRDQPVGKTMMEMNQQDKYFQAQDKIKDAIFYIGQFTSGAHEYHNNLKFLLSHMKQNFKCSDDFVKSIKQKQHVDFDKNQPAKKIRPIKQDLLDEQNLTLQKGHGTRIVN